MCFFSLVLPHLPLPPSFSLSSPPNWSHSQLKGLIWVGDLQQQIDVPRWAPSVAGDIKKHLLAGSQLCGHVPALSPALADYLAPARCPHLSRLSYRARAPLSDTLAPHNDRPPHNQPPQHTSHTVKSKLLTCIVNQSDLYISNTQIPRYPHNNFKAS